MLPTLKLLSKIHICLIGILWGADFLCRHTVRAPARMPLFAEAHATAKLCDNGNFCVSPHLGGSRLAPKRESRGPCPRSAVLRTARLPPLPCGSPPFATIRCQMASASPIATTKNQRPTNLPSAKNQLFNSEISCRIAIANIHYQIAKLLFVIGIFTVFNPCSDEVAKNTSEVFVSCI